MSRVLVRRAVGGRRRRPARPAGNHGPLAARGNPRSRSFLIEAIKNDERDRF
jgi:hypothetical protein